ncbi:glutamate-5-semialdehyde dehydrogenase [Xanthomonas fragariae]|uniref:Gamma-glutamyl phosphate reductase n=1 Tax=Xanthomonas fragariae TaxID=48664 RepID=A0A1Y6H8A6_9XANT|nr:glutamate-5-semialdehyde dehydrogenase [Xanthomonas fragariae]AOD15295.1 glutamate-5-semialdehyde dehydrogenase [Xanthomonas fragariae]AOD18701.1 glutamate-5-semialdehyde dehydrogenase [Xanthomonas fragariae]ENZ97012.1 gamma-glutamyl phosphate reductase [Xanthomonas fragariae LMG 25863]MBL9196358.1 glutamate-5-semialdehyde dehydrogenase [Xanthomonas fragariae]MBL9221751.1 glutamate-5-semialdehyde dehydrogenase [Xanthomonas fragariae]
MTIKTLALQCRDAAQVLSQLSSSAKQALLDAMAAALEHDATLILDANARDLNAAREKGVGSAMLDRLALDPKRLAGIAAALREVALLPDPVGQITREDIRPNGIRVQKMRVPLGVIAMIYEARPNVTADAAALCIKAGNGVILRGGSEAIGSNTAIARALQRALREADVPEAALTLVEDLRRETMLELLQLSDIVDLAIPRGGEGLIRFVAEHARVPVIKHYKGVCHLFVDASADVELAVRLLVDGKATRPSACNSLETLLVHAHIAERFLPVAAQALRERNVELRGDAATRTLLPDVAAASDDDYAAEFLDLILAVRIVPDLDTALTHIRQYGSDHTEVIATEDATNAEQFVHSLRSAVVMVNASSRFSDGGELGLGAEIGISTTRLHSYGPMGLEALTVERFVVRGAGQVRH